MSKPWDNFRAILSRTHHPLIGFLVCFIIAFFIQLTGFGIAIVIPGIITGILLKNNLKAIIIGFLAGFLVWLSLFGIMAAFNTQAFITAWIVLSPQLFTSLIGGVITGVGGQLGAMFAEIAWRPSDDLGLPPAPTERVPTEELPRRKRVKRKPVKKKKKKKRK
jgi:hypothetical protein